MLVVYKALSVPQATGHLGGGIIYNYYSLLNVFCVIHFCGLSQPQKYFKYQNFPNYNICSMSSSCDQNDVTGCHRPYWSLTGTSQILIESFCYFYGLKQHLLSYTENLRDEAKIIGPE